jgi:hypothetical protein
MPLGNNAVMTTIHITLPDQLELVARSAGLLTSERLGALLRQQLEGGSTLDEVPDAVASNDVPEDVMALERLIGIAKGDTGQGRKVADFLLAWWNASVCGSFDLSNLWAVDTAIADDMVAVVRLIASTCTYPDTLGYKDEFVAIVHAWRPELK